MATKMIDVSTWQGNMDWYKAKADGVQGAIIRAGYGRYAAQKDEKFERNYTNAKAAGGPIGAYWYSYATSVDAARAEAETCLGILKGKQFEYPIYYDLEDPSMTGCGRSLLTQIAVTWCEAMEAAGYFVGIYCNPNWLSNYLDYSTIKKYTLWLAQWDSASPDYDCDIWQYTSKGRVSGISGYVDMNWGYRDFPTEIKNGKFNGYNGSGSSTPSGPEKKPVTDAVVDAVLRGEYGNGDTRKQKLEAAGYDYDAVQAAVNARLAQSTTKKPVTDAVVNDVINGKYGNGDARKKNLEAAGYDYDAVQDAVNKKLASEPTYKKVTDSIVNAVIRGDYGNGDTRTAKLKAAGYNPDEVQDAVNKKLASGSSKKKVTDTVVNAVIRGDYGNGDARKKNLEKAGYDYDEVQDAVNKKLS